MDVRGLVDETDETIRVVHIEDGSNVGQKRNFGCSLAAGDVIAHWDDDDYSAPTRLDDQIRRMQSTGCQVTAYHRMRFTDGRDWWSYEGQPGYAIGTSLCYRKQFWKENNFPSIQLGEDREFHLAARRAGQLVTAEAGLLMYATIHNGNTSPRFVENSPWIKINNE